MEAPPGLGLEEGYAIFRMEGNLRFREAVDRACAAITWCREREVRRLLIESTGLTGFDNPGTEERFLLGEAFARAGQAAVKVAIVARPEFMDPERFGVTVARNRGLFAQGFASREDALAWLLDPNAE